MYYEEAHFGHGGHYQSIQPLTAPSSQVEQSSSEPTEDIGLYNQHVDLSFPSMIPPSIDSQVIYIIIIYNHH